MSKRRWGADAPAVGSLANAGFGGRSTPSGTTALLVALAKEDYSRQFAGASGYGWQANLRNTRCSRLILSLIGSRVPRSSEGDVPPLEPQRGRQRPCRPASR